MEKKLEGLFSHHALSDKERKNLTILELIRKEGRISRADISKVTDINIVSISNYVKKFMDENIVVETGPDVSSGGRRAELVELNAKGAYVVGAEVGAAKLRAAMMDIALKPLGKIEAERPAGGADELVTALKKLVADLCGKTGIEKGSVKAIGIGVAGNDWALRDAIHKVGIETYVGSDAACAAYGEKKLNADADVEDLLYMHSDSGCGIVVSGDIYFGAGGTAGEIQLYQEHRTKEESIFARDAQYLRPWGSGICITETAKAEIEKGVGTTMVALAKGKIENISLEVVIQAAVGRDEIATYIVENAGKNLGVRIAYLVNLFNPEMVVVGGGIEKAGELVLDPIRSAVKKFAFRDQAEMVKIIPSALGEDSVSLGAASLTVREVFLKA